MESNNEARYLLSAAIDFGTTYSGLAYSYANDQEQVHVISDWHDGTAANKIPTTILFDANLEFVAFGQKAVDTFAELALDEQEKDHYFFHRFKMDLYKEKGVSKGLQLRDVTGKKMEALKVFSAAIKFLKNHLIHTINERYPDNNITEGNIKWVLTVPAIWDDAAKQFMREAGTMAGISVRNLQIALEPEAASLCCLKTPRDKMILGGDVSMRNTKYLVIDNGGGTVDITAHQIIGDTKLKELYKASGGALGGTHVDEEFVEFLSSLFSKENVLQIQRNHCSSWIQILKDFELAKKKIHPTNKDKFLPVALPHGVFNLEYFNTLSTQQRKNCEIKVSRLRVPKNVIEEMISSTAAKITSLVQSLIQKPELNGIECIVMVGGFSNSPIVVQGIKSLAERNDLSVLVPEEAHLSVVKGAVMFGWKPDTIQTRKCQRTYGLRTMRPFEEGVHPNRHIYVINETEKYCNDMFDTLVDVNQNIEIDQMITRSYTQHEAIVSTAIQLYATNAKDVHYCDDPGVFKIGELNLKTPYHTDQSIEVQVFFGNTEIQVKAKHVPSRNTTEETFDFL